MFTFTSVKETDLPLLFEWLAVPHVAAWWRETRNYEDFFKKYCGYLQKENGGNYFIYHDQKPVGYIAWYDARTASTYGEAYPEPTFGFDLFIADQEYLGKGYAPTIINAFISQILMPMKPRKLIIDPEISNLRAIHVYEKVGFKKTKTVQGTDGSHEVVAQLMERDIL